MGLRVELTLFQVPALTVLSLLIPFNVSLFVLWLSTWLCLCLCWPCAPLVPPPCFPLLSPCLVLISLIVLTWSSYVLWSLYIMLLSLRSLPSPVLLFGSSSFITLTLVLCLVNKLHSPGHSASGYYFSIRLLWQNPDKRCYTQILKSPVNNLYFLKFWRSCKSMLKGLSYPDVVPN